MISKPRVKYPVIVEGKYDRERVLSVVSADCIATDGFGVFNNRELTATIRALSKKGPIIVLTDSDKAGSLIRKRISQATESGPLINLYTPQIKGVEKRKKAPSKDGFLGVEGIDKTVVLELLLPFTADNVPQKNSITKATFFADGLTGGKNSSEKRDALAKKFALPCGMSAKALLVALSYIATDEEYREAVESL